MIRLLRMLLSWSSKQCTKCREVCACVHDLKWSKHETISNVDMRAFNSTTPCVDGFSNLIQRFNFDF